MSDLISRQAVKDIILGGVSTDTNADKEYVCGLIDNIPSVENKGEWILKCEFPIRWECSHCHASSYERLNYCPNCGADMRGVSNK